MSLAVSDPPAPAQGKEEVREETSEERLRRRAYERGCQRLKKRIEGWPPVSGTGWGWGVCAQVYLGHLEGTVLRWYAGIPGGRTLIQSCSHGHPWEPEGPAWPEGVLPLTPLPAVEELQVQILKLLLNNKDENGVSGSQACLRPWWGGCQTGPRDPEDKAGMGPVQGAGWDVPLGPVWGQLPQLLTASAFLPPKGEASRYIFLTKFRKFLQENASGRGVGVPNLAVSRGLHLALGTVWPSPCPPH